MNDVRVKYAEFNSAFKAANETRARYRVICGSAGSGKSCNVAQDFVIKLADEKYKGANLLVVRKSVASCRGSVFAELCSAVSRVFGADAERVWRISHSQMSFESCTGSKIILRGMNDPVQREKLKSITFENGKLTWIWCEEATQLTEQDLDTLDDRLRGRLDVINDELYYQITLTFNPVSSRHWIKRRFFDCAEGDSIFRMSSTYRDNRFIDRDYYARMERRRLTDPDGYAVYGLGEWGGVGDDLILKNWSVKELPRELDMYDRVCLAQDFGFNHANCILLVGEKDGDICIIDEIYVRGLDTEEIITLAERKGFPKNVIMICDSAEPDRIKTWRRAGFHAIGAIKGAGSVLGAIDSLKQRRIVVAPQCTGTIGELEDWRWQRCGDTGELIDIPAAGKDDAMAALRYSLQGLEETSKCRSISKAALGMC